MSNQDEIKRLIDEQRKDRYSPFVRHHIVNPTKRLPIKPFHKIKNIKKRAVFGLHILGFSTEEIIKISGLKRNSVYTYLSDSYREYPAIKPL